MFKVNKVVLILLFCIFAICSSNCINTDNSIQPCNQFIPENELLTFTEDNILEISPKAEVDIDYRLPTTTIPEAYEISLVTRIDLGDFTFTGTVLIQIRVVQSTSIIVLHARQLTIDSNIQLQRQGGVSENIPVQSFTLDSTTDKLSILLEEGTFLEQDQLYTLTILYNGTLRTDGRGFFQSSYLNDQGDIVYLASTHFEPHNARHGFPCYDEPALKANFTLILTHGNTYFPLSNMDVLTTSDNLPSNTTTSTFYTTPPMSSYLVAFVISDFRNLSSSSNGILYRSFARPSASHLLNLSLDTAVSTINAMQNYLQVNYSLPKMDQIAIPDFRPGAMENWGLVIYRESYFLYDEDTYPYTAKTDIVITIVHELAHQWFGNLVSPEWWTYLWLNEGFATLFEYHLTDMLNPNWRIMDYFVVNVLQVVFNSDESETIRPMSHYVEHPDDISSLFDRIAYDKSGCVLRMIQKAITPETFQLGLNYYLNSRQFDYVEEQHLFDALDLASKENQKLPMNITMNSIFKSWTSQSGFPYLNVQRNYEDSSIRIIQERYLVNSFSPNNQNTWWIPYNFVTASNPDFSDTSADDWLPQNVRTKVILPNMERSWSNIDWIIFNKQETGYYRVRYDSFNYNLIINQLYYINHNAIHYLNRAQLIDDAFAFARTNRLDWSIPFGLIRYLRKETEYAPWASLVNHINYINSYMTGLKNYDILKQFLREAFERLYIHIGIEDLVDEPHLNKYTRSLAIRWACYYGSNLCQKETNQILRDHLNDVQPIHQNVASVIYCAGSRNGTFEEFIKIYNRLIITTDTTIRNQYITGLSCNPNQARLIQLLEYTIETSNAVFISQVEKVSVFNATFENSYLGLVTCIDFLTDNSDAAQTAYGSANLRYITMGMAQYASTDELQSKMFILIQLLLNKNYISSTTANEVNTRVYENIKWHIYNDESLVELLYDLLNDPETSTNEPIIPTATDTTTTTTSSNTTTPSTDSAIKHLVSLSTILISLFICINV